MWAAGTAPLPGPMAWPHSSCPEGPGQCPLSHAHGTSLQPRSQLSGWSGVHGGAEASSNPTTPPPTPAHPGREGPSGVGPAGGSGPCSCAGGWRSPGSLNGTSCCAAGCRGHCRCEGPPSPPWPSLLSVLIPAPREWPEEMRGPQAARGKASAQAAQKGQVRSRPRPGVHGSPIITQLSTSS